MSSLFYGLEIAKTGLSVAQQAISITGNNIANADTVGYTRQRLVTQAIDSCYTTRILESGSTGGGVEVVLIDQIRSEYLDKQIREEFAALGESSTRAEEMEFIETILNETSDSSISSVLADFFNSLSELSTDPSSEEIRTNVQQNAIQLTETLNYNYNQLVEIQDSYNEAMKVTVDTINNLLTNIASYNEQIYSYELSGQQANELRDARNVLLDELSELVNIEYWETSEGKQIVTIEGVELVNHTDATLLETSADQTGVVSGQTGYYSIYYEGTTTEFAYSSGELQAYKNLRDGNSVDGMGIPYMLSSLNTFAQSLAEEFNAVHETGYTMPYDSVASQTGIDFFEIPSGGYGDITAGNISVSAEILDNVNNIAASSELIDLSASNTQEGNNEVALELLALTSSTSLSMIGNFEDYLASFVVEVGIESASCQRMLESQEAIVKNLENRRESISGVSLDEEMINLISYQYSYSAASRVLTAIDEALDTLINSTGIVGR
ncbi:MAG: flagellar hook-associated protein FlgK [Eubacteriales bacterium]|nr:flagellar hook-associated protein FlgK [Eubacteriales bacterium]